VKGVSRLRNAGLAIPVVIGLALYAVSFASVLAKAPWSRIADLLTTNDTLAATRYSLLSSTIAAAIAAVVGMPIAWTLARSRTRGVGLLRVVVLAALILPPTVAGTALLATFGPGGVLEGFLDAVNVRLPGTLGATVLGQTFVATPFFIVAAEAGLRNVDPQMELAARTLGASGGFRFRSITFPIAVPGITAGLALAWGRALGEFGASLTFPGDPAERTLPFEVTAALGRGPAQAFAISIPLIAVSMIVIAVAFGGLARVRSPEQQA
jgi:molybdate transport system permease protein